jgi:phytoene synthase
VFGSTDDERAPLLADALGVALQLTNILRDLREDATRGRVYLPADGLATLGLTAEDVLSLANGGPCNDRLVDALRQVVRAEADRAEGWYAAGMQLLDLLDHRSAACCAAMAGIYRRLLHRIAADPSQVLVGRVSLSSWQKASVAVRSLMGAAA